MSDIQATRRQFVRGAAEATLVAAGGMAAMAAEQSIASAEESDADVISVDKITQRLLDRGVAGADLPDAAPIAPVEPPASWDDETDVVIVGLGGGGLLGATYLARNGYSVIGIDKELITGGAGRHAAGLAGAVPDPDAMVAQYVASCDYSNDQYLLRNIANTTAEATDFMLSIKDINLVSDDGYIWNYKDVHDGVQNNVMGLTKAIDAIEAAAREAGADLRLQTRAQALVVDGDRVVGVLVRAADGNDQYLKARLGVQLSAGGFGMNRDLIKAYIPGAYEGCVQGGPMPPHTGEVFRMGLGVGADFAGFNSFSAWEGAIDEISNGGDGEYWHYFWHGERQLFHNPWLSIDLQGNRMPYYMAGQPNYTQIGYSFGEMATPAQWMSAVGHRVVSVCDSTFPTTVFENANPGLAERVPITDDSQIVDIAKSLVSGDWLQEVEDAVERGSVKRADTLEELAEQLGMNPDVLVAAVEKYNAVCEKGVDDEMLMPYDPSWLHPVKEPPFYGALVGGQLGKTMCGLRVNERLHVMREDGTTIPGLYASWSTAGGIAGEGNWNCIFNTSFLGGAGLSYQTGYMAAKWLVEDSEKE